VVRRAHPTWVDEGSFTTAKAHAKNRRFKRCRFQQHRTRPYAA